MEYFLSSFDDVDGICQEYFCHIGQNLCWCGKILCHMYTDGWIINENFGWKIWKMLFVEFFWTTHVYDQRLKGLGIHSKSTVP
jgi:hypothetical protein